MNLILAFVFLCNFVLNVYSFSKCEYNANDVCDVAKHSQLFKEISYVQKQMSKGSLNQESCHVCRKAVCLLHKCIDSTAKWAYLVQWYCWSLYKNPQCEATGRLYAPHLYYIMNNTKLSVDEICGVLLFKDCAKDSKTLNWRLKLSSESKRFNNFETKSKKVLHISDIHYDPYYEPGSVVNCSGFACCRRESESRGNKETDGSAGYWGELWSNERGRGVCGAPLSIIEKTLDYINRTQNIDIILWTGDNTRHLAASSKDLIIQTSTTITKLFNKYLRNATIIVALGNHEGLPNSQYATVNYKEVETFQIYAELGHLWRNWINDDHSMATFLKGGFYSKTINNIKIIALNTNLCAKRNFWTLYDPIDPVGQLKWLSDELLDSEKAKQMAMIIGHYSPTFKNCIDLWIQNYLRILDRFRNVIIGNYFAHSHNDEFNVYYSSDGQPISYGLLASSIVTHNPSYRLYTLNENGVISDAETYFVNLTKLNAIGKTAKVNYRKLYSMRQEYNISAVTAVELDKLYQRIISNDTLLQIYFKNSGLRSLGLPNVCDERCKQRYVLNYIPIRSSEPNKNSAFARKSLRFEMFILFILVTVKVF